MELIRTIQDHINVKWGQGVPRVLLEEGNGLWKGDISRLKNLDLVQPPPPLLVCPRNGFELHSNGLLYEMIEF